MFSLALADEKGREASARQADFAGEQQSHDGKKYGKHKEHVGGAHHGVVGQLVGLTSDLADVEADGKDQRRHAEQNHCGTGEGQSREGEECYKIQSTHSFVIQHLVEQGWRCRPSTSR